MNFMTILSICYGTATVLLMIILIFLLTFHKLFIYSFYRIIVMDLILNIACWCNTWPHRLAYSHVIPQFLVSIYESSNVILTTSQFLQSFFFHVQSLSTIVICTHRLSAAKLENANKIWNRYYILVYLGILVYSYLVTKLIRFQKIHFDYGIQRFLIEDLPEVSSFLKRLLNGSAH